MHRGAAQAPRRRWSRHRPCPLPRAPTTAGTARPRTDSTHKADVIRSHSSAAAGTPPSASHPHKATTGVVTARPPARRPRGPLRHATVAEAGRVEALRGLIECHRGAVHRLLLRVHGVPHPGLRPVAALKRARRPAAPRTRPTFTHSQPLSPQAHSKRSPVLARMLTKGSRQ